MKVFYISYYSIDNGILLVFFLLLIGYFLFYCVNKWSLLYVNFCRINNWNLYVFVGNVFSIIFNIYVLLVKILFKFFIFCNE